MTFEYETTQTHDGTGRFAVVTGLGARYQLDDSVKAGLFVTTEEARSHYTSVVGGANIRITF